MLEFEKRALLSAEAYALLRRSAVSEPQMQTNYYYDTEDFLLHRLDVTCRVREKEGKCVAALKLYRQGSDCCVEHCGAAENPYDIRFFNCGGLCLQGTLTTERLLLYRGEGVTAVLDRSTYLDRTDYELELEYTPEIERRADALLRHYEDDLRRCGLRFASSGGRHKSARFFERKQELLWKWG